MSETRRRAAAPIVAALLALLFAFGCGTSGPTPVAPTASPAPPSSTSSPTASGPPTSEDPLDVYRRIEDQVLAIRGLEADHVEPRIVSEEELAEIVTRIVEEETPRDELLKAERLYKALGLVDPDASLEALLVELLETQVAGLYDPATKSLYVLSKTGRVGPAEQTYFAHEFQHAVQDQNFDLTGLQDVPLDQTDRLLARQALAEGDAYVLMTQWMLAHLGSEGIQELLESASDPEALEALERIPPILREQILFPATQGLAFVQALQVQGGWEAVNDAFRSPPESTEQVLHLEKYLAGEAPVVVTIDDGVGRSMSDGWAETLRDTLGENQLRIFLEADGVSRRAAATAAAGWAGDRLVLLENGDRAAVAIVTEWDTPGDADEFVDAAHEALAARGLRGSVAHQPGSTRVALFVATDDAALQALDRALGLTGA